LNKKIIFIDIDGTLVNNNDVVPISAEIAIKEARNNGHYVFLCTGRSKAEIYDHILKIGFDGMIAAAGGYIEVNNNIIFHKTISAKAAKHVVEYFTSNNVEYYLESNCGLFASKNLKKRLNKLFFNGKDMDEKTKGEIEKGLQPFLDTMIENENMLREDINKVSFLESELSFNIIKTEFEGEFNVIHRTVPAFGENSGELSLPNINKANAIEKLLTHLNLTDIETYAYGDGMNDLEMIQYVKYGIAMGNAAPKLKEAAFDITDTHDEGGIYNSFKKYNII
jgi:Cof subfamily protein (haloacid dehalogenase superfamily)